MKTALFTGAGASRAIGYPLTSELLPRVRSELKSESLFSGMNSDAKNKRDRKELYTYLLQLLPGFEDVVDQDLPLITEVFSLVEYALFAGEALAIGGEGTLLRCRDLLKQAITDILLGDFIEPWDSSDENQQRERKMLNLLTRWIEHQGETLGLITTNYDIGIEYELYGKMKQKDFYNILDLGFDWRDTESGDEHTRPSKPIFRIFKLHGSLDLLKCQSCGYVYFNPDGTIAHQSFRESIDAGNTCHCRRDIRLQLHIVSPSLVREIRDANLLSVWRSALEWMRTADQWIIAGYSLPPEDLAVRSLLLRAYTTAARKPKVTVVQRGIDEMSRYKLFFPDCDYVSDGLEGFLDRPNSSI
ncbi:MAG: hypothetical protein AB1499_00175 [Nitrospirota bacterium]